MKICQALYIVSCRANQCKWACTLISYFEWIYADIYSNMLMLIENALLIIWCYIKSSHDRSIHSYDCSARPTYAPRPRRADLPRSQTILTPSHPKWWVPRFASESWRLSKIPSVPMSTTSPSCTCRVNGWLTPCEVLDARLLLEIVLVHVCEKIWNTPKQIDSVSKNTMGLRCSETRSKESWFVHGAWPAWPTPITSGTRGTSVSIAKEMWKNKHEKTIGLPPGLPFSLVWNKLLGVLISICHDCIFNFTHKRSPA